MKVTDPHVSKGGHVVGNVSICVSCWCFFSSIFLCHFDAHWATSLQKAEPLLFCDKSLRTLLIPTDTVSWHLTKRNRKYTLVLKTLNWWEVALKCPLSLLSSCQGTLPVYGAASALESEWVPWQHMWVYARTRVLNDRITEVCNIGHKPLRASVVCFLKKKSFFIILNTCQTEQNKSCCVQQKGLLCWWLFFSQIFHLLCHECTVNKKNCIFDSTFSCESMWRWDFAQQSMAENCVFLGT